MATVRFTSLDQCELVEVEIVAPDGDVLALSLMVDSGFTGQSSFVLPADCERLAHAAAASSQAAGALSGSQERVIVRWRIASLSLEQLAIAIVADVSSLALPAGIHGLAGLTFLRRFSRWGGEQPEHGVWKFSLSTDMTA